MSRAAKVLAFDGDRFRSACYLGPVSRRGEILHRVAFYRLRQLRSGRWAFLPTATSKLVRRVLGEAVA